MIIVGIPKKINLIKMMLFSVILLTLGCTKSKEPSVIDDDGRVNATFNISTGRNADLNELDGAESVIKSVRIIAFEGDDYSAHYYEANPSVVDEVISVEMKMKAVPEMNIFVIINEPARLKNQLDQIRQLTALEAFNYELADYFNSATEADGGGFIEAYAYGEDGTDKPKYEFDDLPMSSNVIVNTYTNDEYDISVERSLARFDIWLQVAENLNRPEGGRNEFELTAKQTKIEYNFSDYGRIVSNPEKYINPALSVKNLNAKDLKIIDTEFKRAFTIYSPERRCEGSNRMTFTLTGVTNFSAGNFAVTQNLLPLAVSIPGDVILKNSVYKIECKITISGAMVFDYKVLPWTEKSIDVPPFE